MGPYRHADQITTTPRHEQAGLTVISFVLLVLIFGILGLEVIKLVPLYMRNMTLTTVMNDLKTEMKSQDVTPMSIRRSLDDRFIVEGIDIPRNDVTIKQVNDGYAVRIKYESRTQFLAGLWFLLDFDKQVEIKR